MNVTIKILRFFFKTENTHATNRQFQYLALVTNVVKCGKYILAKFDNFVYFGLKSGANFPT